MCLIALALIAAIPMTASARARRCAGAGTPTISASRSAIKHAVVCLINRQRRQHGLPAVRENSRLDRAAQRWTNTMVRHDAFAHGSNFASRISAVGFHWSAAGENIATGFQTPRSVVNAWMASAGHCRNILAPNFADVGTGIVALASSRYGRDFSTWTQDFALPMGARAPSRNFGPADRCPYGG
jgi:uncharacterized protein YkwD